MSMNLDSDKIDNEPSPGKREVAIAFRNVFNSPGSDKVIAQLELELCSRHLDLAIAKHARDGGELSGTALAVREGMRAGYSSILYWIEYADRIEDYDRKKGQ